MRSLSLLVLGVLFIAPFSGAKPPARARHVLHEKRAAHPDQPWKRAHRLPPDVPLPHPIRIGLKQRNMDRLPDLLLTVSDPNSASYGQHWTPQQVVDAFAPPDGVVDSVKVWLASSGVDPKRIKHSANRAWVEVHGTTVGEVEQLLGTEYHVYQRRDGGGDHIGCDSYSLPAHISEVVDFITPTVQPSMDLVERQHEPSIPTMPLAKREPEISSANATLGCDKVVTPDCLRGLYNMSYTPQAVDRNTFGIVNYYSNIYLQSDLDAFFRNYSPALVGKSPELVSIDGGSLEQDDQTSVGEAGWILEYAMSLVQPQPVKLLQLGNKQTGEFRSFNEWLDAVDASYCTSDGGDDLTFDPDLPDPRPGGLKIHDCGTVKAPYVVSNSQAGHEYAFTQFYAQRQCAEFAKLGLMGVTVLYSAGNAGASGAQSAYCIDENDSMNANATRFNPAWPASCPWVTAVGGTQVKAGEAAVPGAEEVWNQEAAPGLFISGGGGFSNKFSTPAYQKSTIDGYLKKLRKSDPTILKHFNSKGRAFPDISANANSFLNVDDGSISIDSGTSGAVPTVASIITLVNDARITAGKKPVGFINPAIYSPGFASAFNDVTSGTNQGCRGLSGERGGGFKADKGWDPASGLGSPNLGLLIEKWLALP